MYEGGPQPIDPQALAAMGLQMEQDLEPEHIDCFPDNWQALHVFRALARQWRIAHNGHALGLEYGPIPGVLQMMGIKPQDHAQMFADLRDMEDEAMALFRERRRG